MHGWVDGWGVGVVRRGDPTDPGVIGSGWDVRGGSESRGREHHHHRQPDGQPARDPHRATAGWRRASGEAPARDLVLRPRASPPPPCARAPSPSSTATPGSCATGATPSSELAENSNYLEVAYLLLHGELPTADAVRRMAARDHEPHLHPRERTQAVPRGVPLRRPSHGHAGLGRGCAFDLLRRRQGDLRPRGPASPDHPAHRQDADPGGGRPPLLCRDALRLPGQLPRLLRQLPLHDVEGGRAPLRRQPHPGPGARHPLHPPCRPRAELLDHRHAGGRARRTPIPTPAARRPAPRCTAPATAGPTRPSSACSPRSARSRTCPPSSKR